MARPPMGAMPAAPAWTAVVVGRLLVTVTRPVAVGVAVTPVV